MKMELDKDLFCVVGLGGSGRAAVRLLCSQGARVRGYDARAPKDLGDAAQELKKLGVELFTGELEATVFEGVSHVVLSPGVPPRAVRDLAEAAGAELLGELELSSRFLPGTFAAIAGTNGKSTVTQLLGDMLERGARPVFVGGNLGTPLSEAVAGPASGSDGLLVVEVSSFQLETVRDFHAHVAVLLNITDDHLDRYDDFALVPEGDAFLTQLAAVGDAKVVHFGGEHSLVRIEGDVLLSTDGAFRFPLSDLAVTGRHNAIDACAAASAALLLGAPVEDIAAALREFRGLPHRMQLVCERRGVRYLDDSKATNVGAAAAALDGFLGSAGKVVLIAGGRDKGGSYAPLVEPLSKVGRAIVCLGEAAAKMERALGETDLPIRRTASMAEAVRVAASLAEPGDTVLLSPACSSYDMFVSYAHRGNAFAGAVRALPDAAPGEGR